MNIYFNIKIIKLHVAKPEYLTLKFNLSKKNRLASEMLSILDNYELLASLNKEIKFFPLFESRVLFELV